MFVFRLVLLGLIAALMTPAFGRDHANLAECKARIRLARAFCRFKANGEYPETFEIQDPFTGKPMIYRREGAGFHLYCLGPNGIDDGGDDEYTDSLKDDIGLRVER